MLRILSIGSSWMGVYPTDQCLELYPAVLFAFLQKQMASGPANLFLVEMKKTCLAGFQFS